MQENKEAIKALLAAKMEMPRVRKDGANPHYQSTYATLDNMIATVEPVLAKHGLLPLQITIDKENHACVRTMVYHGESGQSIDLGVTSVPVKRVDAQGYGSALTYARRYGYTTGLGLSTGEDDDGNAASNAKPDNVMSVKTRIFAHAKGMGFNDQSDIKSLIGKVVAETGADASVDGWLKVEQFLSGYDSDTIMEFLGGGKTSD